MWRVDLEVDGLSVDALVVAGNPGRLVFDLPLDVREVVEASSRDMMELGPLTLARHACGGVRHMHLILGRLVFSLGWDVDEL